MINIDSYPIFKDSLASLKKTSMDDADKKDIRYMTESDLSVINFDTVKTKYANALGVSEETAKSIDALIYSAPCDVFVEFKNGDMKNCKRDVKLKIRDSLLLFCDIIGQNISYTRQNTNFILVYNEKKNPPNNQEKKALSSSDSLSRQSIGAHLMDKANEELIRFDLQKFQTLYFKEVHTYNEHQFEEYLKTL